VIVAHDCDCISREKREGTLGLLFLTPLRVTDVIAGKAIIHVLRALTLFWLLCDTGTADCFWRVAWWGVMVRYSILANAVSLGIAAGIYASTKGGTTVGAMALAEIYSLGLAIGSTLWVAPINAIVSASPLSVFVGLLFGSFCTAGAFFCVLKLSAERLRKTWHEQAAAP